MARLVLVALIVGLLVTAISVVAWGVRTATGTRETEVAPGHIMQKIAYTLLAVLILYVAFYGAV